MRDVALAFAHTLPLVLGGKEAVKAFEEFITSLDRVTFKQIRSKNQSKQASEEAIRFLASFGVSVPNEK